MDEAFTAVEHERKCVYQSPPAVVARQLKQPANALLSKSPSLELRQHHPADLGDSLAVGVVGPQGHDPRDHVGLGFIGHYHLDPVRSRRCPLNITLDLRLHTLARQRTAQLDHHRRVASHPDVGVDIAVLNVT
ncbi:hypothetical protein GCM10010430_76330 [Kitasatospora cystarginea]|uniref:Uncharacterized protein n=1 Tax=Kitasatospora cystarginea TaxID=58350 RepID=A0ABN3EZW6_9ACTN